MSPVPDAIINSTWGIKMPSLIDSLLDEKIISERFDEFKKDHNFTLKDVYKTFDKWMEIQDKQRIDVVLATALTRKLEGTPIWLFLVGPSGDGKSEQVMTINNPDHTVILHEITPNTIVSGMSTKKENFDLAPKLKDKIVIIPDMAQLLHLHPNDKAKVWGQLRELYDGRAGKITGMSEAKYDDIRVTLIACSTPSIDAQILVFTHLGTRELIYRTKKEDETALMNKVMENEKLEKEMRQELKFIVNGFLKYTQLKNVEILEDVYEVIKNLVRYLRYMRATAEFESYTGELRNIVYPEQPTRCLKQFKRLYVALMSLDSDYSSERALKILKHIVISSVSPLRRRVLSFLKKNEDQEFTTSKIAHSAKLGKKTALRELYVLWDLGMVEMRMDEMEQEWKNIYYWKISNKGISIGSCIDVI